MRRRTAGSSLDLVTAGPRAAKSDIRRDAVVKQHCLLADKGDVAAQAVDGNAGDVDPVDGDGTFASVKESRQQVDHRALAGAAGANKGDGLSRRRGEIDILQRRWPVRACPLIGKADIAEGNITCHPAKVCGARRITDLARPVEKGQNALCRCQRFLRYRVQRSDAAHRLHKKDQRGDEGDDITHLKVAIGHPPAGQRDNATNSDAANHFEDRVDLGAAGKQPDKPREQPVKCTARTRDFGGFKLIGLDHAGALQRFGQQGCHLFHMFLKIARRLALARANANYRLHGQRIDGQHHHRHQPVQPQHRPDQHNHRQHIAHQVVGKSHGRLTHEIQVIHDSRHEGTCRLTRQHRQIGLDQGACHVLLQVGCHPKRQRVHLNRLREQRHSLDQRQKDDRRRRQPDHLGGAAIGKGIEDISGQKRIGRSRGGHHRHQCKGDEQPAKIAAHPAVPEAAHDGAAVGLARCEGGRQRGNPVRNLFVWGLFVWG